MVQSDAERQAKNRARSKKWRDQHPDKQKSRCRAWRQENPVGIIADRAMKKGWKFDLTNEWYWQRVNAGVCEKTGLPFVNKKGKKSPFQPSVDRINSSRGYTQDNCQVVCLIFNLAKNKFTEKDVYKFARAFVENYDNATINDCSRLGRSMVLHSDRQKDGKSFRVKSRARNTREN